MIIKTINKVITISYLDIIGQIKKEAKKPLFS